MYTKSWTLKRLKNMQRYTLSLVDCTSNKEKKGIKMDKRKKLLWQNTKNVLFKSLKLHKKSSLSSKTPIFQKWKPIFQTPLVKYIFDLTFARQKIISLKHCLTHNYLISAPNHALKHTWILPGSTTVWIDLMTMNRPTESFPNTKNWSTIAFTTIRRRTSYFANCNTLAWAQWDMNKVFRLLSKWTTHQIRQLITFLRNGAKLFVE